MTKFFPDFLFPDQYFSLSFFSPDKDFIHFFLYYYYYYYCYYFLFICKIYYYHVFFDVLYLSCLSKAVLIKISKCERKQGIEKNNSNDINTTRNCTFVNFRNYTTLTIRKRIAFKLVLIISRSKERVFNSFKGFVWFFDRLCYRRWFKAIQNQITAPSQVLVHLIDPFCV